MGREHDSRNLKSAKVCSRRVDDADLETSIESGQDFRRGQQQVEEVDCRNLHAARAALAKPSDHLSPHPQTV